MENCCTAKVPASTPSPENADSPEEVSNKREYLQMVGSLMYLAVVSRPDIAFAVGKAGRKMQSPTEGDLNEVKRIFRYIKSEPKLEPKYSRHGNNQLIGYADSDWATNQDNRRSTTGYVFTLGGAAISWSSKKQASVALSTTEAEYMALSAANQEALYLRALLRDLKHEQTEPTKIYQDNQGTIKLAENAIVSKRSKHIDVRYHFVRENIIAKNITLEYKKTQEMLADCLTKAVGKNVLDRCLPGIFGSFRLRGSVESQPHNQRELQWE